MLKRTKRSNIIVRKVKISSMGSGKCNLSSKMHKLASITYKLKYKKTKTNCLTKNLNSNNKKVNMKSSCYLQDKMWPVQRNTKKSTSKEISNNSST